MTLEEALKLVDRLALVEPGKYAQKEIAKTPSYRYYSLTRLRAIHEDGKRLCCWCNEKEVDPKLYKYCSDLCEDTSKIRNNTIDGGLRMYLLIEKQQCACATCGLSFEDEIIRRILANYKANAVHIEHGLRTKQKVSYWQVSLGTGKLVHTDHIIPIKAGGHGTDMSNLQVLCVKCHRKKTTREKGQYET